MRDPRCAMMVMTPNLRSYAVLDGDAEVISVENTNAETLSTTLREVYRVAAGKEHPDWSEYDEAMIEQKRVAILLKPFRMYAHGL